MYEYNKGTSVRVHILNTPQAQVSFHQDTELFYLLDGSMDMEVMERISHLSPDDIFVVNANETYRYRASDDILLAKLVIPTQLIANTMQSSDIIFWCDSSRKENEHYDELRRSLRCLLNRYISIRDRGEDFGFYAACYQMLDILTTHFLLRVTDREGADVQDRFEERIVQISNYINANYSHPISAKDLAKKLYLSQGYLSRFFKRNYGASFAEYLTRVRLYHAMDQLLYTDKSVTQVAYACGFSNVAALNKACRDEHGETPSNIRKKLKKRDQEDAQHEADAIIDGRLDEFLRTDGQMHRKEIAREEIEEVCDARNAVPLDNAWGSTINIGSASDLLRSEVRDHVLLLAHSLKFQYVRFWNIFSKDMLIDVQDKSGTYNFSKLDSILDFLVANGLKPHIELGTKPRRLYRNVQSAIVEEQGSEPFRGVWEWISFFRVLMKHLLYRYRRAELNTWRMELWFSEAHLGDEAAMCRYFELFNATHTIVKQFADRMEVGGCGLRPDYLDVENYGRHFLAEWNKQPCQPDFVSFLYYAYERGEVRDDRYSKRLTDNDGFRHEIRGVREALEQTGFGVERIYVTEWNLTISDRNSMNDSCFKGAYILKNMIDNYGEADLFSYFAGSDLISEHYDSGGLLNGGTGLLSKDGVMKAAAYAFKFLGWLFPYYLGKGKHYLLTTDGQDAYGIVCHNQKPLNYNYYLSREDDIRKEHLWRYYENQDPLRLTLRITGVSGGCYQIKTRQINEQTGDTLGVWREMGYETELTRNDIAYLQRASGPKLTIQTIEVNGNELILPIELQPNEFRFIRIRKL